MSQQCATICDIHYLVRIEIAAVVASFITIDPKSRNPIFHQACISIEAADEGRSAPRSLDGKDQVNPHRHVGCRPDGAAAAAARPWLETGSRT